jgi:hypothetical protein
MDKSCDACAAGRRQGGFICSCRTPRCCAAWRYEPAHRRHRPRHRHSVKAWLVTVRPAMRAAPAKKGHPKRSTKTSHGTGKRKQRCFSSCRACLLETSQMQRDQARPAVVGSREVGQSTPTPGWGKCKWKQTEARRRRPDPRKRSEGPNAAANIKGQHVLHIPIYARTRPAAAPAHAPNV